MKIPLVGVPDAPNAEPTFQPVSTGIYDKVGEAGARLGNVIEGVATDLPARIKETIDAGTLAQAQTNAAVHFEKTMNDIRTGPDADKPETWAGHWQDAQAGFLESQAQDPKIQSLSHAARAQYKVAVARWKATTTQDIDNLAVSKGLDDAQANLLNTFHAKMLAGDESGAVAGLQIAVDKGQVRRELGLPLIQGAPAENEKNQAIKMMNIAPEAGGGPIVLEKALQAMNKDGGYENYPHLIGQDREQLLRDASLNARVLQSATSEQYATMGATGQPIDVAQVHRDMVLGKLSPATARGLIKPVRSADPAAFGNLVTQISQFTPDSTHPENEGKIWGAIAQSRESLSPEMNTRLNDLFHAKLKPDNPLNSETAKFGMSTINEGLAKNVFGKYEEQTYDPAHPYTPKTVLNEKAYHDAVLRKADTTTDFMNWLQSDQSPPYGGRGATPQDAAKFIYGFQADSIRTHASAILGGNNRPSIDLDALIKRYNPGTSVTK